MTSGTDYHDYFIRDGRHVGRYEEMYQNCPDPWRIEELGLRLDMRAALLLLAGREGLVSRFLDAGAGLGLFSGLVAAQLWQTNPAARGVITDISPTAVARAAVRLADPRLDFLTLDVRSLAANTAFPPGHFDLVVLAQALWGLLDNLDETLAALAALLPAGGLMLVSQHFPGPGRQGYGVEVVASPEDLSTRLGAAGLTLLDTLETNRSTNHHWAALGRRDN
ncbi:MAG: class I SAM-dependent methyltransferase [Candidatus Adiutrix sp.]|nr:class I SAM-dependent methyltransferase [Candidatus Adiutrix sp.]